MPEVEANLVLSCVVWDVAGEYKYGWHALPRQFNCGATKIVSGRASCDYGIRRRSVDAFNVSGWCTPTAPPPPAQFWGGGVTAQLGLWQQLMLWLNRPGLKPGLNDRLWCTCVHVTVTAPAAIKQLRLG